MYDDIQEISAEVSALGTLVNSIEPNNIDDQFGWGLSLLIGHIYDDLEALKERAAVGVRTK